MLPSQSPAECPDCTKESFRDLEIIHADPGIFLSAQQKWDFLKSRCMKMKCAVISEYFLISGAFLLNDM